MKYFVIFLVLASFTVFMPHAFGSCVSLPCDDANIKLEEPNYRFIDFSYQNKVGEPITFVLEKTAYDQCNSYVATITNEKDETVWEQTEASFCVIVTDQNLITSQIKFGYDPDNKIIMSESAKYLLNVQIDDGSIEREFVVRQNHSGGSLDRTVYPVPWFELSPLKQIKSGISFDKIECKENRVLLQKYNGSPACVKPETKEKLIIRGWTEYDVSTTYDYTIKTGGVTYGSQYRISGGTVDEIVYDEDRNSLFISLDGTKQGYIQIVLQTGLLHHPRELPFNYTVIIDGEEIEFEQLSPVILRIPFEKEDQQIEIVGIIEN